MTRKFLRTEGILMYRHHRGRYRRLVRRSHDEGTLCGNYCAPAGIISEGSKESYPKVIGQARRLALTTRQI